jgi:hypothetical protein
MTIQDKIDQLLGGLASLAALPPQVFDENGVLIPGAYEEQYPVVRASILAAGGPDFAAGIVISGYDPATIEQSALTACLNVCLQLAYNTRWLQTTTN